MARSALEAIPLATRLIAATCVSLFVATLIWPRLDPALCHSVAKESYDFEVYRLMTSTYLHSGWLHILFNMAALLSMGPAVERELGTIPFAVLAAAMGLLCNFVSALMIGLVAVTAYARAITACEVGYSTVLFALIVVHACRARTTSLPVCGIAVPTYLYPWVVLVLTQVLFADVSFFGHLAGVLVGYAYMWGKVHPLLPTPSACSSLEHMSLFARVASISCFVPTTGVAVVPRAQAQPELPTMAPRSARPPPTAAPAPAPAAFAGHGHVLGSG